MPNKKNILIAEDDRAMAKALDIKFRKSGYGVVLSYTGQDVMEKLAQEKFDLLILDLMMPIKDGFAVLEEMQKQKSAVPVVVASNLGQPKDIEKAFSLGAKEYYIKNEISIQGIVDKVAAIIGEA